MPSCDCQRCDQPADCYTVVFEEQQGWERETAMYLCELCHVMYSRLYTSRVIEEEECEDDPILPFACVDDVEGDPE